MNKVVRKRQGKRYPDLSMVLNANRETAMYKQLFVKQNIDAQILKRRLMMEELDGDYCADLLEWISDYIFFQSWKDDKLTEKIKEFRAYRRREYDKLLINREELRRLEVNVNGRKQVVDVLQ